MNKLKRFALMALATLLVLGVVGCGGSSESAKDTAKDSTAAEGAKKVSVAVINDYPPFEFKKDGALTGFDIELVEAIAEKENLEVEWKEMKFDGIIPALQANQVDAAISAITIRPDRAEVVDFTTPYYKSGLSLVVKKDSPIKKLEDLKGKTIVAKQGTTGLTKANELAEQYGAKVKIMQDDTVLYLDVENGNSDATINDFPGAAYKIKIEGENSKLQIIGDKLSGEDYGIAISKGNKELLEKFNDGLKKLQDSGEFQQIYDEYFATK